MSKRTYTDDELIARVWDVEEIKKLANKRVYYQANGWRERELDELWTAQHKDTASYGANTGFYVGLDSVRKWYVGAAGHRRRRAVPAPHLHRPGGTGRRWSDRQGPVVLHRPGDRSWQGHVGHRQGGHDFVKEGDSWKIWHVVEANDLSGEAGARYSDGTPYWEPEHDPIVKAFGTPDVAELTHDPNFNWWDNYPAMPGAL